MQWKYVTFVAAQIVSILAMERRAENVLTATRVYHIDKSPYLVDATSTVVWTESASITETDYPTEAPTPTVAYYM